MKQTLNHIIFKYHQQSENTQDTVRPFCLFEKLISKACTLVILMQSKLGFEVKPIPCQ